jgi:hypothetical protein
MNSKHLKRDNPVGSWAGVVACTAALALVQWMLNKDSIEQPEFRNLIRYILIDLVCFSAALLFVGRLGADLSRLSGRLMAITLGAVCSSLIIDVPFFYRDMPNWRGDTAGWFMHAWSFVLINGFIASLVMTVIYGAEAMVKADID